MFVAILKLMYTSQPSQQVAKKQQIANQMYVYVNFTKNLDPRCRSLSITSEYARKRLVLWCFKKL